jgi:hypothetical protein
MKKSSLKVAIPLALVLAVITVLEFLQLGRAGLFRVALAVVCIAGGIALANKTKNLLYGLAGILIAAALLLL